MLQFRDADAVDVGGDDVGRLVNGGIVEEDDLLVADAEQLADAENEQKTEAFREKLQK